MNVLTVNYNTQELTDCAIKSLNKHTPECKVFVFDNSDEEPYKNRFGNVEVIDNTKGQIINWESWLKEFPFKYPNQSNNYGSAKHCKSVEICFDLIPDGFLLMDSDILIKKDVSDFCCSEITSGKVIEDSHFISIPRIAPYLCYINVPKCREHCVTYFNGNYMWKLVNYSPNRFYDTGAWFLKDIEKKRLPYNKIDIDDYMIHFRNGSWRGENFMIWLETNKELWN